MERSPHLFCSENEEETRIRCLIWMAVWYVIEELGSLAEYAAPAELNADIRLEPGKHELTAEEIAAAKANTAAIANGDGLCLVGVPGGRRPLQSGQLYGVREPVQSFCPRPGCPDPA